MDAGAALANVQALETGRASLGRGRDLEGMNFTALVREARRLGVYSDGMSRADLVAAVQGAATPIPETPGTVQGDSRFVPGSDGEVDLGRVSIGVSGYPEAPIRYEQASREHIGPDRLEAFRGFGYQDDAAFVEDVARNHTHVYRGKGDSLLLAKRNGKDRLAYVELKPEEEGGFYRVNTSFIARPDYVKNKPLLWERAQSNQSGSAGPPSAVSGQSSGAGTEAVPEQTIPSSDTSGNLGGRASLGRFQKVNAPHSEQKGWGKGNLSERAERAIAEGKRTSRMIAEDYGVSRGVVESTLRTNEWHHVLEPGRKTPGMVDFYNFQPDEDAGDAAVLREMQEREKLARKARAGKAAFSRELRRRGFQVEGGRYVNLPDGRIVGSIAGQPGNFGVDLSAALVRKYAWEDVAPLGDLNWGQGELSREQWLRLTGQSDLEEEVESPAKGGEPVTIGAQPDSRRGSRVSTIGGESAEALPIPTAPDTLSVAEMFGVRNSPAAPPASGGRASLGTAAARNTKIDTALQRRRAARALEIAAAPGDIAARPGLGNPGQTAAAQRMVNAVDQARAEEGDPQRRKDTERDLEADNIPEAQAKRNRERLLAGEQADFSDAEIVRLRKDLNAAMEHAIRTGSKEDALNVATMIDAWRGLGTEQARSFRAIPQPGTLVSKWRPFRGEATKPASGIHRRSLRNCAQHPWRLVP